MYMYKKTFRRFCLSFIKYCRYFTAFGAAKPRKIAYKPPDPAALELARENRIKELKMYDILREIIFYSMFLWILMVISYGQRDPNSFFLKENMENNVMLRGDKLYDFNNVSYRKL